MSLIPQCVLSFLQVLLHKGLSETLKEISKPYGGFAGYRGDELAISCKINTRRGSERIARAAFEFARKSGRKKVTIVHKANVVRATDGLFLECARLVAKDYPDIQYDEKIIDNAAMQLVKNPKQFDVMVTGNMFGDILSDEASMLTGSIGMLPSASLDANNKGLYEPCHGSAPDIAGKGVANPLATILSAAMMLRYTFSMEEAAQRIENAVKKVLAQGYRTGDIFEPGMKKVGTREMGDAVLAAL